VVERELAAGVVLQVNTGCIVTLESSIGLNIEQAGNIKTALFGGEGLFFATLQGPGIIWLQSLPFSRLAGRMLQAAPQHGGRKGEGSLLGSIGDLIDGDNRCALDQRRGYIFTGPHQNHRRQGYETD